jgi:hypothetical protein
LRDYIKHLFPKNISKPAKAVLLFGLCYLSYGLLIPWLGYIQDDWYQVWFGRAFGVSVWPEYYAGERPFIAWLYMLTTPLIGQDATAWQLFALFSRWCASLMTWWLLRLYLPGRERWSYWGAILFSIYPGFRQHYAAVIYSHYFLQYCIQIFSIGSMYLALHHPKRTWLWGASLVAALVSLFTSEYFFGLELFRPIAIWIALLSVEPGLKICKVLQKTVLLWLPYLAVLVTFLIWRLLIFRFPTYQPIFLPDAGHNLFSVGLRLIQTITLDVFELGIFAWFLPMSRLSNQSFGQPAGLASLGLTMIGAIMIWFMGSIPESQPQLDRKEENPRRVFIGLITSGLACLLLAGWPFWFVGLPVDARLNSGSRFALSFIPGASLLIVGLVGWLAPRDRWRQLILAVLAGLAVGHHFLDADYYREVHKSQAIFFQQLAWRAPGLKPGTLLLTNTFQETLLMGDNSLTAALNWIYDPQPPYSLDYMLFYIPERLASGYLPGIESGLTVSKDFRTTSFSGSTSQALVVYYEYPRCLRILDPGRDADLPRPLNMPRELRDAIPISNLEQILAGAQVEQSLPKEVFKYIPDADNWCFLYEKAELYRQQGDWQSIVNLASQVFQDDMKLSTTTELLPFIEGFARTGDLEQARRLSLRAYQARPEGRATTSSILCATWQGIETYSPENNGRVMIQSVKQELDCK